MRTLLHPGVPRDQGEGIPKMFAEMVDAFLLTPRIDTNSRSAPVTLQNTPTLASADRAFVVRHGSTELSDDEFRALLHAQRHGRIGRTRTPLPRQAHTRRTTRPSLIAPKEDLL